MERSNTVAMNKIIKIHSNVPKNILRIELFLSNYCNYKCQYCGPESYGNTQPWPSFEKIVKNLDHLISQYKKKLGKTDINFYIGGGEPSLWPDLIPFLTYFRQKHNCKINVSTNGSRTLRWWKENGKYFDHVRISVHPEKADGLHLANVADILYENNVSVIASVLMDPNNWNHCTSLVDNLKSSKHKWIVTVSEILHPTVTYSNEQKIYLENRVIRHSGLWYRYNILRKKKPKYYKPTVIFDNGETQTVDTHWIILNKHNKFNQWSCNVGVDTLFINKDGDLTGSCGEMLYNLNKKFNIYSSSFVEEFDIDIIPTQCTKSICICQDEANVDKESKLLEKNN
jgi:organic radical activating enzyme